MSTKGVEMVDNIVSFVQLLVTLYKKESQGHTSPMTVSTRF